MNIKKINLTSLIFMALCCDMGIIAKKLIAPAANVITEYLHIPGIAIDIALKLIKLSEIDTSPIKRQIVSKKTREISGEGIDLFELVADYSGEDFTEIIVISSDEYKATVSKEEALKKENAVLVFEGNSARLYVFGDTDSKRNVSNVKRIIIN